MILGHMHNFKLPWYKRLLIWIGFIKHPWMGFNLGNNDQYTFMYDKKERKTVTNLPSPNNTETNLRKD